MVVAAVVVAAAVSYNFFVLVPKQQAFSNCMRSYNTTWEEFASKYVKVSTADFCERGYVFSDFMRVAATAKEEVYAQYANPDAVAVDIISKEIGKKIREKFGLDQ